MTNSKLVKQYTLHGTNLDSLGEASSDIKKTLTKLGVDPSTLKRVAVSMYEAEINTVVHGGGGVSEAEITSEGITIVFIDKGPGIPSIEKAMEEGYSTATEQVRAMGFGAGMGLPNMKKNSDELEIESKVGEGTKVTIKIYFKRQET